MFRIITCTIALLCVFVVFGQNRSDTIKVYFELNRDEYNPNLFDNASVMARFIEKVDRANLAGLIERIDIYGYSSPEGSHQRNQRLSDRRCRTIADYIISRTGVDPHLVTAKGMGEAWDELRDMVEANPDVPYRSRVLDIIDNTPEWIFDSKGRIISGRKKRLMDLAGGRPYRWLVANIFPELRYALTVSVQYVTPEVPEAEEAPAELIPMENVVDSTATENIVVPAEIEESVAELISAEDTLRSATSGTADLYRRTLPLAFKTNLLYYAALLPNIEVEWRFNDHWSVALEGALAWWGKYSEEKSYRLAVISPEVKRWIRPRAPWHGFYVGAFAGAGLYDFEKPTRGYNGEGVMAGLSVGYMWPVGRHFSFEAAAGAGYLYTRAKEYRPMQGHHVYQRTKDINYFGPLKLKFSLVWHPWESNKRGRKNNQTIVQYEK